jgi:hypothetical protein
LPSERRLTRTREKAEIKADVQDAPPLNSSGIVALFEEQWADEK